MDPVPPIDAAVLTSSPVHVEFLLDILVLALAALRARGFLASNLRALPFGSLSTTTCCGTYVLPPTHSSGDSVFLGHWECDAGQGGDIAWPMPLQAFIKAAAAYKIQYSRQLAEPQR